MFPRGDTLGNEKRAGRLLDCLPAAGKMRRIPQAKEAAS